MLIFYQKNKINFKIKEIINLNQISNQELLTGNLVDKNCYDFIKNNKRYYGVTNNNTKFKSKYFLCF